MHLMGGAGGLYDATYLYNDGRPAVNDLGSHLRSDIFAHIQYGVLSEQHAPIVPAFRIHETTVAGLGAFDGPNRDKLVQRIHGSSGTGIKNNRRRHAEWYRQTDWHCSRPLRIR